MCVQPILPRPTPIAAAKCIFHSINYFLWHCDNSLKAQTTGRVTFVRSRRPPGDSGEAASGVTAALAAYADGTGSEHAALLALAAARLLVPVVAVPAGPGGPGGTGGGQPPVRGGVQRGRPPRSNSEMALPTLIGNDGRTAIIAFTGTETLSRWQED